jgi:DNA helicase HerA-like ATPase
MRANPAFDTEAVISELGVGEALVSLLDEKGRPEVVHRAFIVPPGSRIGPIDDAERKALLAGSVVAGIYDTAIDRESAFERLQGGAQAGSGAAGAGVPGSAGPRSWTDSVRDSLGDLVTSNGRKDSVLEAMAKSAARTMGSTAGRAIVRGVLGTLLGGSRRR